MTVEDQTSFTIHQLESLSGFDRRTIAYYIQEGLLPRVGRRGPKTEYPALFLERLLFIRNVRDMQDAAKLRAVTLDEIRKVIHSLSNPELHRLAIELPDMESIRSLFSDPDWDTSQIAVPAEKVASRTVLKTSNNAASNTSFTNIKELVRTLDALSDGKISKASPQGSCTVKASVRLSDTIFLSIEGLQEVDHCILEELGAALRQQLFTEDGRT